MGAYVEKRYPNGFLLTEENLLKVADIITKRIAAEEAFKLEFSVYRKDDFFVTYEDVKTLVKEDNSRINSVVRLHIAFESKNTEGRIIFSKRYDTSSLRIQSEDRDAAFLLASDLKEYLKSEVFIYKYHQFTRYITSRGIFPISAILGLLVGLLFFIMSIPHDDPSAMVASHNIEQKINFLLLRTKSAPNMYSMFVPILLGMVFPFFLMVVSWIVNSLTLDNTFYWGKEISIWDSKKALRDKMFWGIGIALVIGVISSFAFDIFKKL